MKWIKENPFLTGIIVAAVLLLAASGYLLSGSVQYFQEQEEAYRSKVQQLHKLQNTAPYPNEENLEKVRSSLENYKASVLELRKHLDQWQPPFPVDVSPQQFQDDLRRVVSELQTKAEEAEVTLPPNFYLGFNEFQTGLPGQSATPALARQLGVIQAVVAGVISEKVDRIDSLSRVSQPSAQKPTADSTEGPTNPENVLQKSVWEIAVTGEQARVRNAFNGLLDSPQFLVIRSLQFANSSKQGPPRTDPSVESEVDPSAQTFDGSLPSLPMPDDPSGQTLPVILGREQVEMKVQFELLDFAELKLE